ncbi:purine nucleosidase [Monoraphidium neglectum]|uniref:Purine nucleosidase n=1 Tax=Monoraphidium neglectum TaxID=145388 RepID=A0A0D2MSQ4_9CHLO|nr:purine nucleosidase [Monoraphidium neglectum]KIZ05560.1 purine nucleosidase [Monoraphidium neglectum]|eukprot:XP_013904579.1 purine nucleosidase [Monoraphidium neglectum]
MDDFARSLDSLDSPGAAPRPIPVWLDCDPGHDDAMAIILAAYDPRLQLLGISTLVGKALSRHQAISKKEQQQKLLPLAQVTRNALDVLSIAGVVGVDVVQGQARPLLRPSPLLCPEIHGESGLDGQRRGRTTNAQRPPDAHAARVLLIRSPEGGPVLPHGGGQALPGKAPVVMAERIGAFLAENPRAAPVRLICTGALTNAALLLMLYPELHSSLEIVIMGGALGVGNTGPVMEFNIQTDPEAAKVVFEAGLPLTMVPIEVTHTALVTPEVLGRLLTSRPGISKFKVLIEQLLTFFAGTYREVFKFTDPPLHDPCAVAYVADPSIFEVEEMRVDIETASPLSAGQTVCDVWHQTGRPKNCRVARSMDVNAFWGIMIDALDFADIATPLR